MLGWIGSHDVERFELWAAQHFVVGHAALRDSSIAWQGIMQQTHIASAERVGVIKERTSPRTRTIYIMSDDGERMDISGQILAGGSERRHFVVEPDSPLRSRARCYQISSQRLKLLDGLGAEC